MKKSKGHTLNIVLILMMIFFSMITYQYSRIKTQTDLYHNILLSYELSAIEMRCMSYINYCLVNELSLDNGIKDDKSITFMSSDHQITCFIKIEEIEVHFIVDVDYEQKKIKSMKFV